MINIIIIAIALIICIVSLKKDTKQKNIILVRFFLIKQALKNPLINDERKLEKISEILSDIEIMEVTCE